MKIKTGRRLLVVVDSEGRIVGTAPMDAPQEGDDPRITVSALPGQTVHEVPLPQDLEARLSKPGEDLHKVLSEYQIRAGPALSLLMPTRAPASKK